MSFEIWSSDLDGDHEKIEKRDEDEDERLILEYDPENTDSAVGAWDLYDGVEVAAELRLKRWKTERQGSRGKR